MNQKKTSVAGLIVEIIVRAIFFIAMPAAFASGFLAVKLMFTAIGAGEPLNMDTMWVLIGLVGFTIVFGRFFCGFVCAFGTLGDAVYALSGFIQKRIFKRKRQLSIPEKPTIVLQKLKYVVLFVILVLCVFGIYKKFSGWSPWDVFSRIMVFRLPDGGYWLGILLLILIVIGMAFKKRFFCQFLCPMGALFSLLPILPFSRIHRNDSQCIKDCQACKKSCPVHLKVGENILRDGECISCGRCKNICPRKNLTQPESKLFRHDIVALLLKAGLFFVMGSFLGLCRFW